MSDSDETVVIEFVNEETDEPFETVELPAAQWAVYERIADEDDITPEQAFRRALLNHLDVKANPGLE